MLFKCFDNNVVKYLKVWAARLGGDGKVAHFHLTRVLYSSQAGIFPKEKAVKKSRYHSQTMQKKANIMSPTASSIVTVGWACTPVVQT